jgi:lipid II:glycine glycyltransferase (peptidoglycan interpeptide bridge formation enzyme)
VKLQTEAEQDEFAQIHQQNIGGKKGVFKTGAFFKHVFQMARTGSQTEIWAMKDGSRIASAMVLIKFNNIVEYHTTGIRDEYRSLAPMNRLIIDCMAEAGMRGFNEWNFGGTWKTQEGVYLFKRSFGAEDRPYYYDTCFFRDLDLVRKKTQEEIQKAYPLCFVIPFHELEK